MFEPRTLALCGDLHGNPHGLIYAFERALEQGADAVVQLGDFSYWEHMPGGKEFLDGAAHLVAGTGIPLYWIDGNHENHQLLRERHADSARTPEGFWTIRPGVYYIPRGTRWTWQGRHIMGLGGAASIDKARSIARENGKTCPEWGITKASPPLGKGTLWWPEEEISETELAYALSDPTPLDLLFTHDKPRASNPRWNRKDRPVLFANQDKIQTVVRTLTPKVLVHGHLHFPYEDLIRCGDNDKRTIVYGLAHEDGFDGEYVGWGQRRRQGSPSGMMKILELRTS